MGDVAQKARRRAKAFYAPERKAALHDRRTDVRGAGRIYRGADRAMGAIGQTIGPGFANARQGFLGGISKASDLLGGGGSVAAATAAGHVAGASVGSTLGALGRMQGTAQAYNAGMGEAMQNEGANLQTQFMLDYRAKIEEIEARERSYAMEAEEQIRAQRAQNRLEKWFSQWLEEQKPGGGGGGGDQAPDNGVYWVQSTVGPGFIPVDIEGNPVGGQARTDFMGSEASGDFQMPGVNYEDFTGEEIAPGVYDPTGYIRGYKGSAY